MEIASQPQVIEPKPKNWLVESILTTIFCCTPFGIVGIVYAAQVNSKYQTGDYPGAIQASKDAGRWTKIAFWLGIGLIIASLLFFFVFGGMAYWMSKNNVSY